ncbi:MAG: hypothetical protein Q9159_007641 [Coniocarpon cinnabarinum]
MAERLSHAAIERLGNAQKRSSNNSQGSNRRDSSQVSDINLLRKSIIINRGSLLTQARQSRSSFKPKNAGRIKQQREAKDAEKIFAEQAKIIGTEPPAYDFLEMCGKGSFGRVFKARDRASRDIVCLKIIEVDSSDAKLHYLERDESLNDFKRELKILRGLKEAGAKNVNLVREAFNFYSSLWIVTDFCSGGSVRTLMKSCTGNRLEERFIIPICRELIIGLQWVHKAGIVHRDLKAANVLIAETGGVQLADFGVSATLETSVSKRTSQIGSLPWMAPEMFNEAKLEKDGYGYEVDIWGFGSTVYEMAYGSAPNELQGGRNPKQLLRQNTKTAPKLEGDDFSTTLKQFVDYCLVVDPHHRPSPSQILNHTFIKNTASTHPVSIVKDLVEQFVLWETTGGERTSLFNAFGALNFTSPSAFGKIEEEWRFSVSDHFTDQVMADIDSTAGEMAAAQMIAEQAPLTAEQQAVRDEHERFGKLRLMRLFDMTKRPYDYGTDEADIRFRDELEREANKPETIIDLDLDDPTGNNADDDFGFSFNNNDDDGPWFLPEDGDASDTTPEFHPPESSKKRSSLDQNFNMDFSSSPPNEEEEQQQEDNSQDTPFLTTPEVSAKAEDRDVNRRSRFFSPPRESKGTIGPDFEDIVEAMPESSEDEAEQQGAKEATDNNSDETGANGPTMNMSFKFPPDPAPAAPANGAAHERRNTMEWSFATSSYVTDSGADNTSTPSDEAVARPSLQHSAASPVELPIAASQGGAEAGDGPFGPAEEHFSHLTSSPAPSLGRRPESPFGGLTRAPSVQDSMGTLRRAAAEADDEDGPAAEPLTSRRVGRDAGLRDPRHRVHSPAASLLTDDDGGEVADVAPAGRAGLSASLSRAQRRSAARAAGRQGGGRAGYSALPPLEGVAPLVARPQPPSAAVLEDPRAHAGEVRESLEALRQGMGALRVLNRTLAERRRARGGR